MSGTIFNQVRAGHQVGDRKLSQTKKPCQCKQSLQNSKKLLPLFKANIH
jgi:hypothetical protein